MNRIKLRDMAMPTVLGYALHRDTLTPIRTYVDLSREDYGYDPIGDGTYRMVPSGDIVDYAEMRRRLAK